MVSHLQLATRNRQLGARPPPLAVSLADDLYRYLRVCLCRFRLHASRQVLADLHPGRA